MNGWIWRNLPTVQGRLITGLALVSAIVVGLWPDHPRPIDPARAAAVGTAAVAWLFAEIAGAGKPRDHDVSLFNLISEIMNDDALTFLQQHDFNINLHTRSTQPVNRIAEWHGSRYDFLDRRVQKQWLAVRLKIDHLAELYGANLVSTDQEGMLTARLLGFGRHNQPPQVADEIKELNDTASALYNSYNAFARFARQRLGL